MNDVTQAREACPLAASTMSYVAAFCQRQLDGIVRKGALLSVALGSHCCRDLNMHVEGCISETR